MIFLGVCLGEKFVVKNGFFGDCAVKSRENLCVFNMSLRKNDFTNKMCQTKAYS